MIQTLKSKCFWLMVASIFVSFLAAYMSDYYDDVLISALFFYVVMKDRINESEVKENGKKT